MAVKHEYDSEPGLSGMKPHHLLPGNAIKVEPLEEGEVVDSSSRKLSPSTLFLDDLRPSAADSYASAQLPLIPFQDQGDVLVYPQTHTRKNLVPVLGKEDQIIGLDPLDLLDRTIGIKPRNQQSDEIQMILSHEWQNKTGKQFLLPDRMQRIIHQFMVANRFVSSRAFMEKGERKRLWLSLRLRLDLQEQKSKKKHEQTATDEWLKKCLAITVQTVDKFIIVETKRWRAWGLFQQGSGNIPPRFHACTRDWADPDWNGRVHRNDNSVNAILSKSSSQSKADLRVESDQNSMKHAIKGTIPQPVRLLKDTNQDVRQPLGQLTDIAVNAMSMALGDDGRNPSDLAGRYLAGSALTCSKAAYTNMNHPETRRTTRYNLRSKRSANDDSGPLTSKRQRIEPNVPTHADFLQGSPTTLDALERHEKDLVKVIDSVHLAHGLLMDSGLLTARVLSRLQQDWATHGYGSCLADALKVGHSHVIAMAISLGSAMEFLSVLEKSNRWEVGPEGIEVNCACPPGRLYSPSQAPWAGGTHKDTSS